MKGNPISSEVVWSWTTAPNTLLAQEMTLAFEAALPDALSEGTVVIKAYENDPLGYGIEQLLLYSGYNDGDMFAILKNLCVGLSTCERYSPQALAGLSLLLLARKPLAEQDDQQRYVQHVAGAVLVMAATQCLLEARLERERLWSGYVATTPGTGFAGLAPDYLPVEAAIAMERLYATVMANASTALGLELEFINRVKPRPEDDPFAPAR